MKTKLFLLVVVTLIATTTISAKRYKILMVVPPELYHDTEFSDPMIALDSAGIRVDIASTKIGIIKGVLGDSIHSTLLFSEAKIKQYDAICIMGGKGTGKYLWENEELKKLIVEFSDRGKLVTAICAGSVCLAKSGILKDRNATTFPVNGFITQLQNNGAIYSVEPVVVDGKIITSNGPLGARAFGREIVKQLKNMK